MAKAKKPSAAKDAGQQAGGVSLLPPKPVRSGKAPGTQVELITNLYPMLDESLKKIYLHTLEIDPVAEKQDEGDSKGDAKRPTAPRRIPKEMRREALENAVNKWLQNNPQKLRKFHSDSNASAMYSMFKMLDEHDGKTSTRKSFEVESFATSDCIVDGKVAKRQEKMVVKIFSPTLIDVPKLIDVCTNKSTPDSDRAKMLEAIRAINVILVQGFMKQPERYLCMQHKSGMASIFPNNAQSKFKISEGVLCNKGYTTSVRPTEAGLVTVVSNTCAPFYQPLKLLQFLKDRYRVMDFSKPLQDHVISELRKEFKTKQVEATHINYGDAQRPHYRKYRVHDIGKSTTQETFELKDDATGKTTKISVFEYFKKEYPKCPLKYPNLPCILDNKRKIPLEICQLVDKQKVNRKLEPMEQSTVIKQMAVKPEIHFNSIKQNAADVIRNSQPMKEFGLEIDQKPIEVTGRELPPITLLGARQVPLKTQGGGYDARRAGFVKPAVVNKWALVIIADDIKRHFRNPNDLKMACDNFSQMYQRAGKSKGVNVGPLGHSTVVELRPNDRHQLTDQELKSQLRKGFEYYNSQKFDHIIFVLPACRDWLYSYMQYLEVDVPKKLKIGGKCTRASRIKVDNFTKKILGGDQRSADMFLSNLWLKYNTKLGGVNIALDSSQKFSIDSKDFQNDVNFLAPGYLFVSIDVCHPAPGDRLEQSVAAAVGMWNITSPLMSHCTRIRVQRKDKSDQERSTVEQVGEIGVMFQEILEAYRARTDGKMPTHIVILRDGVSEGQFQMVLRFELGQVKAKIANYYNNMKLQAPKLTCLTVQKRHKVRFMRKVPAQTPRGSDYNMPPGTVVDNKVVQPHDHSFYMAPHKAIQGTARAPYIYMILDEIKFSQDAAQAMIFALSYLSPRCTKGTSIPTPVNLADLAAERGKNIVISWNEDNQQRMSTDERLAKLNAFLSEMGDSQYHNTLYYV